MKNIKVIYWTGTGNTEKMAHAIVEGAKEEGANVDLLFVTDATAEDVKSADAVALGCPAMGAEELEETCFRPFIDEIKPLLSGKATALFGSYEWADGQWMKEWVEEMDDCGARLVADGLIAYDDPDEDALYDCKLLGRDLARS